MNLPACPEDEAAIINCCLLGGLDTATMALESLPPDAFMRDDSRAAFRIIETLVTTGTEVNVMTFSRKWAEGKNRVEINPDLTNLDAVPSAWNLPYYVEPVIEAWRKRQVMERCYEAIQAGENGLKADAMLDIVQQLNSIPNRGIDFVKPEEASDRLMTDLEARYNLQGRLSGIETGFTRFDRITDGLQSSEMTVVAARPSIGKSAFGSCVAAKSALENKIPTLIVSLEMSVEGWMRRMLCANTQMKMGDVRAGSYTKAEFGLVSGFNALVKTSPIYFINGVSGLGITQLTAAIQRYVRIYGIKLVVVDYLQKIKSSRLQEKKTYEVGEVSSGLKAIAEKTKAAFLVLAQLSRENEKTEKPRPPRLTDLADSGQIERDADTVGLLHRDINDPEGAATLFIAKQRDGEVGNINLRFRGAYCRFENPMII